MREGGGCMYEFSQDYEELARAVIDALPDILAGNSRAVILRGK